MRVHVHRHYILVAAAGSRRRADSVSLCCTRAAGRVRRGARHQRPSGCLNHPQELRPFPSYVGYVYTSTKASQDTRACAPRWQRQEQKKQACRSSRVTLRDCTTLHAERRGARRAGETPTYCRACAPRTAPCIHTSARSSSGERASRPHSKVPTE